MVGGSQRLGKFTKGLKEEEVEVLDSSAGCCLESEARGDGPFLDSWAGFFKGAAYKTREENYETDEL